MKLIICGDSHTEALIEGFGLLATDRPQLRNDVAMKSLGRGRYLAQPFAAEASGGAVAFTYDEYANAGANIFEASEAIPRSAPARCASRTG